MFPAFGAAQAGEAGRRREAGSRSGRQEPEEEGKTERECGGRREGGVLVYGTVRAVHARVSVSASELEESNQEAEGQWGNRSNALWEREHQPWSNQHFRC